MRALNPLTSIMCGFTAWIIVVGLNNPWVSTTVMITALVVGTVTTRNLSLIATTLALSLPTGLSMLLIYVPFAATYRDGLVTAGQLSLRFAALIAALLAALTAIRIPELVKALQTTRIHHSISFILGSAIQFLPQAHDITRRMRDACQLAGRTPHPGNLVIPVLVQVLYHGGQRATAMTTMGLELPGRRTVLRPPPDSPMQKLVRILLPLAAITLVIIV